MSGCGGESSWASRSNAPKVTSRLAHALSGASVCNSVVRQAQPALRQPHRRMPSASHRGCVHNPSNPSCGGPAAESPATPLVCLGGGTPHKPPVLRESGHVLHEGTELADFLRKQVGQIPNILLSTETTAHCCRFCSDSTAQAQLLAVPGPAVHSPEQHRWSMTPGATADGWPTYMLLCCRGWNQATC